MKKFRSSDREKLKEQTRKEIMEASTVIEKVDEIKIYKISAPIKVPKDRIPVFSPNHASSF